MEEKREHHYCTKCGTGWAVIQTSEGKSYCSVCFQEDHPNIHEQSAKTTEKIKEALGDKAERYTESEYEEIGQMKNRLKEFEKNIIHQTAELKIDEAKEQKKKRKEYMEEVQKVLNAFR